MPPWGDVPWNSVARRGKKGGTCERAGYGGLIRVRGWLMGDAAKRGMRATAAMVALVGGLTAVTTAGTAFISAVPASADAPLCGTTGVLTASAGTVTCTYTAAGEDTFNVPSGVSTLDITAVGARRWSRPARR